MRRRQMYAQKAWGADEIARDKAAAEAAALELEKPQMMNHSREIVEQRKELLRLPKQGKQSNFKA
jgi:hypothetical protein